ncbi:MAG: hypothetical protein IPJ56_18215 [Gemmatimonadetes bacterium]|nr:hypothetical protein [Gemmatimonadota bacterium]
MRSTAPQGPVPRSAATRGRRPTAGPRPDARDRDLPGQRWWRQHAQWQWSPDESRPDARTRRHLHLRSRPAGPGARRFDLLYGESGDQPGSFDNADIELRPDVLVYTGEVLRDGLELSGPIRAYVHLSSDAPDTD